MDDFCRGCLLYCDDKNKLVQYTEKNRRLFIYATGIQVKQNDFFKFQICKDCLLKLQATCQFKKQCRTSDKIYNKFMTMKDTLVDFHDFVKTSELSSSHKTTLKKNIERNKEEIASVSPSNSILNFMNAMDEDIAPTEESIINEVIQEDIDIFDESLDSHWLEADDPCIDFDFRFTPFLSPRNPTRENMEHCYVPLLDNFSKAISTMKMSTSNLKSCGIDRNIEKALIRNKNQCSVADLLRSPSDTQSIPPEEDERNKILQDIRMELESMNNINNKAKIPVKNLKVMKDLLRKTKGGFNVSETDVSFEDEDNNNECKNVSNESEKNISFEDKCDNNENKNYMTDDDDENMSGKSDDVSKILTKPLQLQSLAQMFNHNDNVNHNSDDDMSNKSLQSEENVVTKSKKSESEDTTESKQEIIDEHFEIENNNNDKEDISIRQNEMKSETYYHIPKTPWDCKLCDLESFNRQLPLKRHYAKEHNIDITIKITPPKQKIICIFCGKISTHPTNAKRHLMTHKNNKKRNINGEDKDTKKENKNDKTREIAIKNKIEKDNLASEHINLNFEFYTHYPKQPIKCKHCDKTFTALKALKNHSALEHKRNVIIKTRQEKRDLICQICGKISTHPSNAKRHLKIHQKEDEPVYKCSICGLQYNKKSSLLKHSRAHYEKSAEKNADFKKTGKHHKCTQCPYTSTHSQNMKTHMRRHSKDYVVFCDICSKGFYAKDFLIRHMRVHIGDKPYCCTQCPAKFSRCDSLSYHMRSHTGERPYFCDECNSVYATRSELLYHKRVLCLGHPLPEEFYTRSYGP